MGVVPAESELSRATVVALLGRLLGDDPDLREGVAAGEFAELLWEGDRISTQWFVHPGRTGVSELVVSIDDAYPLRPARAYRAEAARVVEVLQELAAQTGGRFVVEEGDVTGVPLDEVLDMISTDAADATPTGAVISTATETPEEYLRRYLDAGDARLGWLREQAGATGGPPSLDFSRDSLAPLWDWAIGRLRLRAADAALERVVLETGSVFQRPGDAVLPMWYGRNAMLAPYVWSDDSLAVIDAVAFYAAECVRRAVPALAWRVGHEKERGYVHEGQPVLAGRGRDLAPVNELLSWLVGKVYALRAPDIGKQVARPAGEDLRDWFDAAVAARC